MMSSLIALAMAQAAPQPPRQIAGSISDSDYPAEAIRRSEQGTTAVQIDIDAQGAVAKCDVEVSSGSATLDAASCAKITERFRYSPARNAEGQAVPGRIRRRIIWRMPQAQDVFPFVPFTIVAVAHLRAGQLESCTVESEGLRNPAPNAFCEAFLPEAAELRAQFGTVTAVTAFRPEGTAAFSGNAAWGDPIVRKESDVVVDPSGTVVECRLRPAPPGAASANAAGGSACNTGQRVFEAATGTEMRRGQMTAAVFASKVAPPR